MRISDWSSDVCSSDLTGAIGSQAISGVLVADLASFKGVRLPYAPKLQYSFRADYDTEITPELAGFVGVGVNGQSKSYSALVLQGRSEEHTSELQSLMRISYAVFCLKKQQDHMN